MGLNRKIGSTSRNEMIKLKIMATNNIAKFIIFIHLAKIADLGHIITHLTSFMSARYNHSTNCVKRGGLKLLL